MIRAKKTANLQAALLGTALLSVPDRALAESAFGPTRGTVDRIGSPEAGGPSGDGVYGRFNGDVSLQIGAGIEADFRTTSLRPLVTGDVTLYQTLGLYGSYREGLGGDDPVDRIVSVGLSLSPLFLIRWPRDMETGAPVWDLTLDSLALSGGLALPQPVGGALFDSPAAEFGLGMGLPLLGRANGLWLRARGQLMTGDELGGAAWLYLSWQGFTHTGILKVDR